MQQIYVTFVKCIKQYETLIHTSFVLRLKEYKKGNKNKFEIIKKKNAQKKNGKSFTIMVFCHCGVWSALYE